MCANFSTDLLSFHFQTQASQVTRQYKITKIKTKEEFDKLDYKEMGKFSIARLVLT